MRTTTEGVRRRSATLLLSAALGIGAVVIGCHQPAPPLGTFEVTVDGPVPPGKPATPPELVYKPWQVWINQERPRQKKNPAWSPYAAKAGAMLDLAPDGSWRCLLTPVRALGRLDEHGSISDWTLSRSIRCSTDGFRSYLETIVRAGFAPDGTPAEADPPAAVYLNDMVSGQVRFTAVVLKAEGSERPRRPKPED